MKAIKIDVTKKTVTEIQINPPILQSWYKEIECQYVQTVGYISLAPNNMLLVDEEANINGNPLDHFLLDGKFPFKGHGLIVGFNPRNGEERDHSEDLNQIFKRVTFFKK